MRIYVLMILGCIERRIAARLILLLVPVTTIMKI